MRRTGGTANDIRAAVDEALARLVSAARWDREPAIFLLTAATILTHRVVALAAETLDHPVPHLLERLNEALAEACREEKGEEKQ